MYSPNLVICVFVQHLQIGKVAFQISAAFQQDVIRNTELLLGQNLDSNGTQLTRQIHLPMYVYRVVNLVTNGIQVNLQEDAILLQFV